MGASQRRITQPGKIMKYQVVFKKRAQKEIINLPADYCKKITNAIDCLEDDPRPSGAKKLSGQKDRWRIRVGDYRILYIISETDKLITIYRIGHRKDIYRLFI